MILISHRGNIDGPSKLENHPDYIDKALSLGYNVEVDVRILETGVWLGHDEAQYNIDLEFLLIRKERLWCHAKNLDALFVLLESGIHCFWQQNDDYAVTSKGYIFTHSSITDETKRSVLVSLDGSLVCNDSVGVCSDYIQGYSNEKN